jgi:hypothetical protein
MRSEQGFLRTAAVTAGLAVAVAGPVAVTALAIATGPGSTGVSKPASDSSQALGLSSASGSVHAYSTTSVVIS